MDEDKIKQEAADEQLVNGAFQKLLDSYLSSRHRKKVDIITKAFNFAKQHNITVVLKGHNTVIANSKNISINHTGNAGMATAGSGDMLSGIMAAFLAQNMGVFQSAESAVHIHGICGDKSRDKYSETSTTPTSMIEMLPFVFKEIEQLWKD